MAGHIATSKRTDWCTPAHLVNAAHDVFRGPPALDPCSNPASVVGARRAVQLPEDGLALSWWGPVYCNPPYGRELPRWVEKFVGSGVEGILLIPAAVDTRVWQIGLRGTRTVVCFLRGRVRFLGAPACAPMAVAAVYQGPNRDRFAHVFGRLGVVVPW